MSNDRDLGRIDLEPGTAITAGDVQAMFRGMKNRQQSALAVHRSMVASGSLARHTRLEYRCHDHGCCLARVFDTPKGPAVYKPSFRYSPERNENTAPTARQRETLDGERRWREQADLLDVDPPAGQGVEYWLNCDHLLNHPLRSEQINADLLRDTRVIVLP